MVLALSFSVLVALGAPLAAQAAPGILPAAPTASPAPGPSPAPAAPPAAGVPAAPADAAARAEAEAAASQRAVQDLEAQVIELRRTLEAVDRQRQAFDDVRRRLDELEGRLSESERRRDEGAPGDADEAHVVRFRDDGFFVGSPDRRFLLRPRLRLQTVYEGVLVGRGAADPAPPNRSGFTLEHAEVILEGHVADPRFEYRLQIDVAEAPTVNDAFAGWRPPAASACARAPQGAVRPTSA